MRYWKHLNKTPLMNKSIKKYKAKVVTKLPDKKEHNPSYQRDSSTNHDRNKLAKEQTTNNEV